MIRKRWLITLGLWQFTAMMLAVSLRDLGALVWVMFGLAGIALAWTIVVWFVTPPEERE